MMLALAGGEHMTSDSFVAPDIVPFLRYRDAPAAIDWLVRVLGFEKVSVFEGEGGTIAHAVLRFGTGAIQLSSPRGDEVDRPQHTLGLGGLYCVVDDPDALFERARNAGGEITRGLTDEDYGSREFSVRDPEGNVWSFGTYRPGRH
jgi:uncharacterized glyoxalase superfamily protein PhnB